METALFTAVDRLLFALGLTLTFLPALLGRFGFLAEFMGSKAWSVPARLTYSVFLTHTVVMGVVLLNFEASFFWTQQHLFFELVSYVFLSFFFAFLLSMFVEVPFMNLEKVLFARGK
jgi:peptidoglycan/LPS O-acetylase OafA/YrhL